MYFRGFGLLNALIKNYDSTNIRPDAAAMFENFVISGITKLIEYTKPTY